MNTSSRALPAVVGILLLLAPSGAVGIRFGKPLCDMAGQSKGGWVEYRFPKPGEQTVLRKVAYVRSVEGTSYQVGSGIYDETAKIEDLQKLSDAQ